jgi:predicted dehydrogenase
MKKKRLTRRKFLKTSAGTLAAASLSTVPIACQDDDKAPDELRLAVIGTGRRGQDHIAALGYLDMESALGQRKKTGYPPLPGQRVVAVADTYKANLDDGARQIQATLGEVAKYKDYRDLLDREDLDAVVIATPDHLHTPIAIAAINKGLDVYVEKSISNNLAETFELEAALQKQGRILQSGFQTQQDHMHELAAERPHRQGAHGRELFPPRRRGRRVGL